MKLNATPKRFLSVRLTPEELEEVYQHSQSSSCRSLTEYVKKVLTKKPVTVKVRNQSQDDLLNVMSAIKSRLDQLGVQAEDKNESDLIREIAEIRMLIQRTFEESNRQ